MLMIHRLHRSRFLFIVLSIWILISTQSFAVEHKDPIVIGMSAAFTGPSRGLGIELYRGAKAYIQSVNKSGGISGHPIIVKVYDDGYNPIPAVKNTISLIQKDNVFLLFNYVGTPTVSRILPLLKQHENQHKLLYFPFTGAQPQREYPYNSYVFNLRASYREETKALVDYFIKSNRKRIAVFYQIDAYGRSGWDGVKRALAGYGISIVAEATYKRGAKFQESMNEQVRILKKAKPDAIICIAAYSGASAFIRDARVSGWDLPIANVSFVGSESMLRVLKIASKETGKDLTVNLINSQVVPSYEDISLPAVKQYREMMLAENPSPPSIADPAYVPVEYSFVSFEGFLNAKVLVEVLRRMEKNGFNSSKLQSVTESISGLDIGIDKPISFSKASHQGFHTVYFTTVQNGKFQTLKTLSGISK